jgi:catechol-2,3-dioxygenase
MPIQRLNHAVLYVRDLERTAALWRDLLDFRTVVEIPGQGLFLQAPGSTNDHDLAFFQVGAGAGPSQAGRGLVGASDHTTTKSIYAQDPDGIEFEVAWLVPADQLDPEPPTDLRPRPLDLARERARYGADTLGGVGVSHPAPT